jgi:hypothetical protein
MDFRLGPPRPAALTSALLSTSDETGFLSVNIAIRGRSRAGWGTARVSGMILAKPGIWHYYSSAKSLQLADFWQFITEDDMT